MDRIATELQHMIFAAADRADIPNLRLTCKTLAGVGLHYKFSALHLSFNSKSLNRLEQICQLPARHCLKSLTYNIWLLRERSLESFLEPDFDQYVTLRGVDPPPDANASERERRVWGRSRAKAIGGRKTKRESKKEWREYQAQLLDQQTLRDVDYGQTQITAILIRLTNLKRLQLCYWDPQGSRDPPYGVPQTHSVLRAIDSAGTRLESLCFSFVNWRLFETQEELHGMMKRAVSTLQKLTINVRTNEDNDFNHQASAQACAELFRERRPLDFFQSMPCLQVLRILFEAWDDQAERVDLKYVVGQFCWPRLRKVLFSGLETTTEALLQFFQRHAETLRNVTLDNINLVQGSWPDFFRYIRTSLNLKQFGFGHDFADHWDILDSTNIGKYVLGKIDMSFEDVVEVCQSMKT